MPTTCRGGAAPAQAWLQLLLAALLLLLLAATPPLLVSAQGGFLPFPTGDPPQMGSLQRLPELQCFHPSNRPPAVASLNGTTLTRGPTTCAAPIVDVGEVIAAKAGTAVDDRSTHWLITGDPSVSQQVRGMAAEPRDGRFARLSWWVRPEFDLDGRSTGDFDAFTGRSATELDKYRGLVISALTLQRNTDSGEVQRVSGKYEVLTVSSVTRAVCLHADCSDLTAVDTTGRGACSSSESDDTKEDLGVGGEDALSVVTHTTEGGLPLPVSAVQRGFLGLGRAVMVRGGWLPNPKWDLTATLHSWLDSYPVPVPDKLGGANSTDPSKWALNASAGASDWLAKVAFVLCKEPVPQYLDKELLCEGIQQADPDVEEVTYDKKKYRQDQSSKKGAFAGWAIVPARGERLSVDNCTTFGASNWSMPAPAEPLWLAGTASREINGASPEERGLAGRLGRCSQPIEKTDTWRLDNYQRNNRYEAVSSVEDVLLKGSYAGVDAPDDAFSRSEAFVTGMLVAITAIGAATFVPDDPKWNSVGDLARFALTATVGLSSVASFGLLYWKERKGARWITSTTHKSLHVAFSNTTADCRGLPKVCNGTADGLRGTNVLLSETVAVVTTNGYRPLKILLLGWGAAALYATIVGAIFFAKMYRGRSKPANDSSSALEPVSDEVDGGKAKPPATGPPAADEEAAWLPPPPPHCWAARPEEPPQPTLARRALSSCLPPRSAPPPSVGRPTSRPDRGLFTPLPTPAPALVRSHTDRSAWRSSTGSPLLPRTPPPRSP